MGMAGGHLAGGALLAFALACAGCRPSTPVERLEWPVMGTVAAVQAKGRGARADAAAARRAVQASFKAVEALLNAHDPASEVSRLARLSDAEAEARCAVETRPCYAAAFSLARASGGAFSPRWRGPGTLDLGAIAKGFAVDLASGAVRGNADALVDLGGTLKAVRGVWTAGVKDPCGGRVAAVVTLRPGEALSTSATYFRGAHVFDGRTGRPVSNGVASVTVLASSALWADGLSTALFVLGPDAGERFLREALPAEEGAARPAAVLWILAGGRQVKLDPEGRFR